MCPFHVSHFLLCAALARRTAPVGDGEVASGFRENEPTTVTITMTHTNLPEDVQVWSRARALQCRCKHCWWMGMKHV